MFESPHFQKLSSYLDYLSTQSIELLTLLESPSGFSINDFQFLAVIYAIKFILLIALFVFVRGGLPRYRYDFLTKVGWIQMLNFILFTMFATILPYLTL